MAADRTVVKLAHHEQQELCATRAAYRQGRKLTAVKVYTVNDESQHLVICGVPKLKLEDEIRRLVSPYGDIKKVVLIPDYPTEEFTEVYHVHYGRIQSARIAKRFVDGKNFFGGILHVFYAPELETLSETRAKLIQRRREIATRIKRNLEDPTDPGKDAFVPKDQYHRKKRTPALPLTEARLAQTHPGESLATICKGIPRCIDPRPIVEPSLPQNWESPHTSGSNNSLQELPNAPYRAGEAILMADAKRNVDSIKARNYRGKNLRENKSTRITRPHIIDTRNIPIKVSIPRLNDNGEDKKVFVNAKKIETGIKIKLTPKEDKIKKRIVIKNPNATSLLQQSPNLQSSISLAKTQIREAMQKKKEM